MFPLPPDTFPGYIDWTRFDGNIDNLVQEMKKLVQETCQEVKEMCQGVKDICLEVRECVTSYRKWLQCYGNVPVVRAKLSIFPDN